MTVRSPLILFVAAAGPRLGFGHLVRSGALVDALGVARHLVLRGPDTALHAALAFGWTVHRGGRLLETLQPDLVVVDDPSRPARARWVRLARRCQIPVAVVADADAVGATPDLIIDGSLATTRANGPAVLAGPAFAVLHPRVTARRARHTPRQAGRVLVALGGGIHVRQQGVGIAAALAAAVPGARVDVMTGFAQHTALPRLAPRCRWVAAPHGLDACLASASVAVVAGGMTLYEALALGTPTVAVPVVRAQRPAIDAAAAACAAWRVVMPGAQGVPAAVAHAVSTLLAHPARAQALGRRARQLVDGRGASRVATRLLALAGSPSAGRWSHAA